MPHTTSSDGDHETVGWTTSDPADLETGENNTVIGLLKKILFLLESAIGEGK